MTRLTATIPLLMLLLFCSPAQAAESENSQKQLTQLAEQAYIFGYPLLIMNISKQVMTSPGMDGKSTINTFFHKREFPDHTFTDVVSPNADTLYSSAWLDLSQSPVVLDLPEMDDRYYLMQLLDGWTNVFASLGSRTTGNRAGRFLLTGPDWRGEIPQGMTQVKAPTNMVWILGRTQTNGKDDYTAVHAIQDKYALRPLLDGAAPVGQPVAAISPLEQVERLDADTFFAQLNYLMADNPPTSADKPLLEQFALLGIAPAKPFDMKTLPPTTVQALQEGAASALTKLADMDFRVFGKISNGWSLMPDNIGNYGTDYLFRAYIARFAVGANLQQDAIYPGIRHDDQGALLNGKNRYIIRFPPGQMPPVRAFWSIAMYDSKQRFVANPINRYAIGDRDQLVTDADGGLTIYIQHDSPGSNKEANWLPAPASGFNMIMRLYWPEATILNSSWPMPSLQKIE